MTAAASCRFPRATPQQTSLAGIIAMLALALPSSGCHLALEAIERGNQERRDDHARVALEKACTEKDIPTLQKVYSSRNEDHVFSQRCVAEIKVEALLATSCELFSATFDPLDHTESKKPDKNVSLDAYADATERDQRAKQLAEKALECKTTHFLLASYRVPSQSVDWPKIIDALDQERLYGMFRDDLKGRSGVVSSGQAQQAISWLVRKQDKARCGDLEAATRDSKKPHPWRGVLLPFFVDKKCAAETKQVATELLASSWAEDRMDACRALQGLGDKSQLAKMKRLAETDPARSLERQGSGFWEYAFVTHPVREACQGAINQLELRDSP